uniref:Uncharacterized protein n=1 Tax=Ciona savignyi TaxID=51511 RepID=H2ZJZ5_CIOSA
MINCMTDIKRVGDDINCSSGCKELVRKKLKSIVDNLKGMTKCGEQAEALATGYMYLGSLYKYYPEKSIACYRSGLWVLEHTFGENAKRISDYGTTTHNLAATLLERGEDLEEVKRLLEAAVERQQAAVDFEDSSLTKEECVRRSVKLLKEVQMKISFKASSEKDRRTAFKYSQPENVGNRNTQRSTSLENIEKSTNTESI